MNVNEYLDRIQIEKVDEPDYNFLEKLVLHHLKTVPFENLYVRQGKKIVLEEKYLYRKIVIQNRGGFCYELNGLFGRLLQKLGFSVSMVSGEVYIPSEKKYSPPFDHMALLVRLNRVYIVDVGFGDSFRTPLPLTGAVVEDVSGIYRSFPQRADEHIYLIQKSIENVWQPLYRLTTFSRQFDDFIEMCQYHSTSPDSKFTRKTVCTIARTSGRITLSDDNLTITENGKTSKSPVSSHNHFKELLNQFFKIEL